MSKFDFHVSLTSICRITSELNILNKFQKPKEKLTVKQKENRLNFAKNFLSSPFYNLPIVFTDESMIALEPFRKKIKIIPLLNNEDYFYEKKTVILSK